MSKKLSETLSRVGEEIFESLAFVLPAFDEEEEAAEEARTLGEICFHGPVEGTLALSVPNSMLEEISINMLGLDCGETPPAEQQRDAFRELLNVTCGNLLPQIAGTDAVFNIDVAEVRAEDDSQATNEPLATVRLLLDGGFATLSLFVPDEASANELAA